VKKNRALIVPAVVLGLVLIAIAIVYWVEPASSLPGFFPGHEHSSTHHTKHGIAAFLLGLALLAFAWFQTGGEKPKPDAQ
jgi:ammonia channel protein AmtB